MYTYDNGFLPGDPPSPQSRGGWLSSAALCAEFRGCADYEYRRLHAGEGGRVRVFACWIDGLISGADAAEDVLRPLCDPLRCAARDDGALISAVLSGGVYCPSAAERHDIGELCDDLTHGRCVLVFDGVGRALSFDVKSSAVRAVGEPTLEKSLKGGKDTFVETLRTNTALLRRHAATPRLKLAESTLGRSSRTRVALLYVEGAADPAVVAELAARLDAAELDSVVSLGALEDCLSSRPRSPFPQLLHTERPDRLARYLLDGRVGLLVDGLPIALVLPVSFAEFMKVTGDGSMNYLVSGTLTLLRYAALVLGLYLPAVYAAVASFHREMIPTRLLLSIIEAKKDVPFSTSAEVLGMLFAFALLQEAGLRLPNPVGDTVSIIGALIVGQSAVEARIVSPIAIIVVAVSGIACYTMPSQDMGSAVRLCRTLLLLAGISAGLYGVGLASCLIATHLSSIESFGVSYCAAPGGRRTGLVRPASDPLGEEGGRRAG